MKKQPPVLMLPLAALGSAQIVQGNRRARAMQELGMQNVPVPVQIYSAQPLQVGLGTSQDLGMQGMSRLGLDLQ